jgi:hypothetical protein
MPIPDDMCVCLLCGLLVPIDHARQIERDIDNDSKSCPCCCRTYGEARREEIGDPDCSDIPEVGDAWFRNARLVVG